MKTTFEQFLQIAVAKSATVYVDMDGTFLEKFEIPAGVQGNKFLWWNENLDVTPVRPDVAELCVELKAHGCKLVVWTNRPIEKMDVTKSALGKFVDLFSDFQFFKGKKSKSFSSDMFVIDDDKSFKGNFVLNV